MNQVLLYSHILLWVVQLFVLFCLFLIFRQFGQVYLNDAKTIAKDGIRVGKKAPDLTGNDYVTNESATYHVQDSEHQEKMQPTLLVFISPSCAACRNLLPDWNQAVQDYQEHIHFVLIGLSERQQFEPMFKNTQPQGSLILDPQGTIFRKYKVSVTPFAFMTDEHGVVQHKGLCNSMTHIKSFISSIKRTKENA